MYQGPLYGIRQLVDVASQALSPAVNQPTTAVIVIDRLEELPLRIGRRPQPTGLLVDADVVVRLMHPEPTWAETVDLAFTEIAIYGESSPAVTRRLVAAYESLRPSDHVALRPDIARHLALRGPLAKCRDSAGASNGHPVRIDEDSADDVGARGGQDPVSVSGRPHSDPVGVDQGRWSSCES
jgi:uncharacterized membrane protein